MTAWTHRRKPLFVALALGAVVPLLAACGPSIPLNIGVQDVPLSLALGRLESITSSPLAPLAFQEVPGSDQGIGTFASPTIGTPTSTATPTPGTGLAAPKAACPALNPLAPISFVPSGVTQPPVPDKYSYKTLLSESDGGKPTTYDGPTTWTVGDVTAADKIGEFTYQVTQSELGDANAKTSTYGVVPFGAPTSLNLSELNTVLGLSPVSVVPSTIASPVALPDQPGLYLDNVSQSDSNSSALSAPLSIVQFPIVQGASFAEAGVSGGDLVKYTSTVFRQTKVNACGNPIGVWEVRLSDGTLTDEAQNVVVGSFSETLDLDTAAGGLVVAESYTSSGTHLPSGVATFNEFDNINVVPKADQ